MAVLVVNLSHIGVAYIGERPTTSQDVYDLDLFGQNYGLPNLNPYRNPIRSLFSRALYSDTP